MSTMNVFRKDGNSFIRIGASVGNVNNTFKSEEMEIGTWINEKDIYRIVASPSVLTEVPNAIDPYHYTYRTDVIIENVDQIISGIFLGTDVNGTKFSSPCHVYIKENYLHFSSSATISIETSHFNLIVEYTKNNGEEDEIIEEDDESESA